MRLLELLFTLLFFLLPVLSALSLQSVHNDVILAHSGDSIGPIIEETRPLFDAASQVLLIEKYPPSLESTFKSNILREEEEELTDLQKAALGIEVCSWLPSVL